MKSLLIVLLLGLGLAQPVAANIHVHIAQQTPVEISVEKSLEKVGVEKLAQKIKDFLGKDVINGLSTAESFGVFFGLWCLIERDSSLPGALVAYIGSRIYKNHRAATVGAIAGIIGAFKLAQHIKQA